MKNIPKTIHYCWFGKNTMPLNLKKYVDNWKNILTNYEIVEWNENNFDIKKLPFTEEAYESKMWAFVSDYVRLYALYNYGGIYLDTDMELINNFDRLLDNEAFCGFESRYYLGSAVIGSKKGNLWIKDIMDIYQGKHFINSDGTLDKTPNTRFITDITEQNYKLKLNNKYQRLSKVTVYPRDYFYPESLYSHKTKITNNSIGIHHWNGSWCSEQVPTFKTKIHSFMYSTLGDTITEVIYKEYRKIMKK